MAFAPIDLLKQPLLRSPATCTLPNASGQFLAPRGKGSSTVHMPSSLGLSHALLCWFSSCSNKPQCGEFLQLSLQNELTVSMKLIASHEDGSQAFIAISDLARLVQIGISNSPLHTPAWVSHIIPKFKILNMEPFLL